MCMDVWSNAKKYSSYLTSTHPTCRSYDQVKEGDTLPAHAIPKYIGILATSKHFRIQDLIRSAN